MKIKAVRFTTAEWQKPARIPAFRNNGSIDAIYVGQRMLYTNLGIGSVVSSLEIDPSGNVLLVHRVWDDEAPNKEDRGKPFRRQSAQANVQPWEMADMLCFRLQGNEIIYADDEPNQQAQGTKVK
jgi:hypothetical protein